MDATVRALVVLAASLSLLTSGLFPGAVSAAPSAQFDYQGRAAQRFEAGDFAGAVEDYTRAIQGSRNNDRSRFDAYVGRGNARARLGDLAGAMDDFTHALIFANGPEAYVGRVATEHPANVRIRSGELSPFELEAMRPIQLIE